MKVCSHCREQKPSEDFYRRNNGADGRRGVCKLCMEAARRGRTGAKRRRNAELPDGFRNCKRCGTTRPIAEFPRDSWKKDHKHGRSFSCKHCRAAQGHARYWRDPETARRRTREAYQRNAAKYRAYGNQYRREHLEEFAERESARRARLAGLFVERVNRLVVLELDDGACGICGEDVDPFDFQVDHVVPITRGGEHSYANSQVAHPSCNNKKRARLMDELDLAAVA